MMAKIESSTWPAVMLAKSRIASEKGRIKKIEKNSIGTTRNFSASGTPDGLIDFQM